MPQPNDTAIMVEGYDQKKLELIRRTIAVGATNDELALFIYNCRRTGLDPLARQIYFIKVQGKVIMQTSIDGFRLIAERSDKYEGQTKAEWCGDDGVWMDVWISDVHPTASRVGVHKTGFKEPLYAVATWREYSRANGKGSSWDKMPALMLAKVAEALALRKAFPQDLSGLYTNDEITEANKSALTPPSDGIPDAPETPETTPVAVVEPKADEPVSPARKAMLEGMNKSEPETV